MFLICTKCCIKESKKISPALGVVWASVGLNLISLFLSLSHSCVYSLWLLGCMKPWLCLSHQFLLLIVPEACVCPQILCVAFCLSLTKDFAQYSVSSLENMIGEKWGGLYTKIINRVLQGKKSSTQNCAQMLSTYVYLLLPSLNEHFLCLSHPAFIILTNGYHSAYIRYSVSEEWKNTQQDKMYAPRLCYRSLLHGHSKALKGWLHGFLKTSST